MDTAQDPEPQKVTATGLYTKRVVFEPSTFKVDQKFFHCAAAMHSDIDAQPDKEFVVERPTKAELAFIEKTFCEQAKGDLAPKGIKAWTQINKNTFLVKMDDVSTGDHKYLESLEYRAVLKSYEGRGDYIDTQYEVNPDAPKPAFSTDWKRFFLSSEHPSHLSFRWSKVELWNDSDYDELETRYNAIHDEVSASAESAHANDFRLYQTKVKIYMQPVNFQGLVTKLWQMKDIRGKNMIRNIIHAFLLQELDGGENVVIHGSKFFDGREAHPEADNHKGRILVDGLARHFSFNSKGQIMVASEPVAKYFFPNSKVSDFMVRRFEGPPFDRQQLDSTLRGKLVRLTPDGPQRGICEVPEDLLPPTQVTNEQKDQQWLDNADAASGYLDLPVLALRKGRGMVPAEMCTFVPMQSCGRKAMPTAAIKFSFSPTGQEITTIEEVVLQTVNKPSQHELDAQFQRVFGAQRKPNFLFVEVNVKNGANEIRESNWKEFDEQIYRHARVAEKPSGRQPLSLVYDEHNDNLLEDWRYQLADYATDQGKTGRNNFIIASIPASLNHNSAIYRLLKTICDTKIGIQSFFVGASTLCQDSDSSNGPVGNVFHRMRLRNPKMLLQRDPDSALDLAVAVHIGPVTPEGPYLLVIVARNMETAENYQSEITLGDLHDKKIREPMSGVLRLLDRVAKPPPGKAHRITVFRSGFMSTTQSGRTEKETGQRGETARILKGDTSVETLALAEHKALQKGITSMKKEGPIRTSYILVDEPSSFGLAKKDAEALAKEVKQKVDGCSVPSRAVVFAASDAGKSPKFNVLRNVNAETGGNLITLNVVSGRLPSLEVIQPESEGTVHEERKRLARIFTDDHLGLYNAKWPIPTHLAHLAMQRASEHLVCDKVMPAIDNYTLPPVANQIANTLYYL